MQSTAVNEERYLCHDHDRTGYERAPRSWAAGGILRLTAVVLHAQSGDCGLVRLSPDSDRIADIAEGPRKRLTSSIGVPLRNPPGTICVSLTARSACREGEPDLTKHAHYRQPDKRRWRSKEVSGFSARISLAYRVLDTT
jgi:hypothetical protein